MKLVSNFRVLILLAIISYEGVIAKSSKRKQNEGDDEKDDDYDFCYKVRAAAIATGVLLGGTATVFAAPVVIGAAGFTSTGIAGGSVAASVQAGIGNVAAGGMFAGLQSAGMAGFSLATKGILGMVGGGLGLGVAERMARCFDEKEGDLEEDEELEPLETEKDSIETNKSTVEEDQETERKVEKKKIPTANEADDEDSKFWANIEL